MAAVELPRYRFGERAGARKALLVHGLSSSAAGWWQVVDHLVGLGWDVTTIDLRGHGFAPRASQYDLPDYAADLLGIWPAEPAGSAPWDVVIGHSLGGSTTLIAAAAEPGWASRLVLVDPVLQIEQEGLRDIRAGIVGEIGRVTAEEIARAHPRWHRRDTEAKAEAVHQVEVETVDATVARPKDWQLLDEARKLSMPTLIVGADRKRGGLLPQQVGEEAAANNGAIDFTWIRDAGHSVHRDDPKALFAAIDPFLG